MIIHKTAGSFYLSFQKNNICVDGGGGGEFYFKKDELSYIKYSDKPAPYRYFIYQNKSYVEFFSGEVIPSSFTHYKNKQILLKDESGEVLDLSEEKIYTIVNNKNDSENGEFAAIVMDYPASGNYSLAFYDSKKDIFTSVECFLFGAIYKGGFFYGLDFIENKLLKIDKMFNLIWKFTPEFESTGGEVPILHSNVMVTFIGPKEESRQLIKGRSQYTYSGGVLVGLNDADGSLAWEREMPNAVDNYQLVGDVLYVASLNEILLINPANGELINRIDTEASVPFDRSFGLSVYVDDAFIYYSHYDDAVMLIYDVNTLALQRRIDLPTGYYAQGHNFYDKASGKQYFTLANRTQYVAQGPVLEIDPQFLDEELEFEQEPEITIKLQTSPDNEEEKELLISLAAESLDDALRFGEIYTRDEAQRYSYNYMDMTFQDRPFTPETAFNGIIRFQYAGCNQASDVVEEHLRVMEKRFSKWVEKEGFYSCVNKKQFTQLKAEYINCPRNY